MTLHLVQGLTTTGRRRGKQKFRNAEAAQAARQRATEWAELKTRWGVEEQERKRNVALKAPAMKTYTLSYPPGREPKQHIPSRDTGVAVAPARESQKYTGGNMVGIGQLHKSNAVPVFSQEDAVEISRMRRG